MGLGIGEIQQTKNTAELVADALRSAILQGKLSSGQSLKQDEIAGEFNVSKIPVREALVQLQAEGLVRLIPSRGATVSRLSYNEISEIYTIRIALEPIALRRAIPLLTDADFHKMDRILHAIDHETDMSKWAELNWAFHSAMYAPANLPRLTTTVQTMYNNVARYLLHNYLDRDYLAESQEQHRAILEACKQNDADLAVQRLLDHLGDPVKVFTDLVEKN
jgi:DNA-binding GntR family transcriptional regulator